MVDDTNARPGAPSGRSVWERVRIDGDPGAHGCSERYIEGGRPAAAPTIGRDDAGPRARVSMEYDMEYDMEYELQGRAGERVA